MKRISSCVQAVSSKKKCLYMDLTAEVEITESKYSEIKNAPQQHYPCKRPDIPLGNHEFDTINPFCVSNSWMCEEQGLVTCDNVIEGAVIPSNYLRLGESEFVYVEGCKGMLLLHLRVCKEASNFDYHPMTEGISIRPKTWLDLIRRIPTAAVPFNVSTDVIVFVKDSKVRMQRMYMRDSTLKFSWGDLTLTKSAYDNLKLSCVRGYVLEAYQTAFFGETFQNCVANIIDAETEGGRKFEDAEC